MTGPDGGDVGSNRDDDVDRSDDHITASIDKLIDVLGDEAEIDPFVRAAGQLVPASSEW